MFQKFKKKVEKQVISVYLPKQIIEQIDHKAKQQGLRRNTYLSELITLYVGAKSEI